ncbi:MAG TPA: MFS transporter [Acidocella sp.]|uniref:MFS transporter n=1 Tax=Acidocella sp. TaxID=50710 RepID=UPI002C954DB0|nr:MFS transporter [Acidocella sp.]HVE23274.1 MFS transporter [Acidocella sp.]
MNHSVNAAARLDRLPMGSFHRRVLQLVGLGMFFDGFDNSMGAGVLAALVKNHWSTIAMNAHFISATFVGLSIGAVLSGFLGDRFGRRFAYQFNLLIFGVSCVLSSLATSMDQLIILRGIMGIGIGAEYVVGYSTVSEFMPPKRRGRALAIVGLLSMSGGFAVYLVSTQIIPHFGWRPMYIIGGAGALWVWYMRRKLPESPRWLEKMGRTEEAERVLAEIEREASQGGAVLAPVPPALPQPARWVPVGVLFAPAARRRTMLALLVNLGCMVGSYSFISWIPSFFVQQGFTVKDALTFSTIMTFGNIVGPTIGIFIADRLGRRRGLIYAAVWCAVAGLAYALQTNIYAVVACGFLLITGITLAMALGVGGYTPELFPTEYRFRGNGVAQMVGRIGVILSPYLVVKLFHAYGTGAVMIFIAALYVTMALCLTLFGIETNQRSLEAVAPEPESATSGMAIQENQPSLS